MITNQKNNKWWIFLVAGGLIVKLSYFIYGRKRKQSLVNVIKNNFGRFAKKEEKEIKKLETGNESIAKYYRQASRIFIDYFIPHHGNGHKPKILHTKSLIIMVVALMAVKFSLTGYLFFIYPNQAKMESQMTSDILTLINAERQKNDLKPLAVDPILTSSAAAKGDNMLLLGYFAHYGPDGKKPWDWIDRNQYKYLFVGENLAMNFYTAKAAHDALMASPSHKKNILNDKYDEVGLAVVTGKINGENTNILVEMFASRQQPKSVLAAVAGNQAPAPKEPTSAIQSKPQVLSASNQAASETKTTAIKPKPSGTEQIIPPVNNITSATPTLPVDLVISSGTIAALTEKISDTSDEQKRQALVLELTNKDNKILSPNPELDLGLNNQIEYVTPQPEDSGLAASLIKWSKYIYVSFLILLIVALLINIFVRITIQHKPVIIEAIIVIIFISSLLTIKLHFIEYIVDKIAII